MQFQSEPARAWKTRIPQALQLVFKKLLHGDHITDFSSSTQSEYVLCNSRIMQQSRDTPLQITSVNSAADGDNVDAQQSVANWRC